MCGRGVGRALLEDLIAWCRARGVVKKINLGVVPSNESAIALYRSLGFVEEGLCRRRFKIDGAYVDDLQMGLWLGEDQGNLIQ